MLVYGWRENRPCSVHPGRACFLEWVAEYIQDELFPLDSIGGAAERVDTDAELRYLDRVSSVSAVDRIGIECYDLDQISFSL